jgi:hypothetical protein
MNIPSFSLWTGLPGFERFERALKLTEEAAFAPEGFLRWLNTVSPAGKPPATKVAITVADVADETERIFRQQVEWWVAIL